MVLAMVSRACSTDVQFFMMGLSPMMGEARVTLLIWTGA